MFREGAREALGDLGDIDSRVNALWRRMSRELRCVAVETVLGLPNAGRLSPMHQEEAYTLERPVLEALGRILSARTRPVEGTNGWAHLLARALKATGQSPSPTTSPPPHGTWDRVLAAIARCMDHGNQLLAALEIPEKVVLVPLECSLPENLWPPGGGTPDGGASSPGKCAGEPRGLECPQQGDTGERGGPLGSGSDPGSPGTDPCDARSGSRACAEPGDFLDRLWQSTLRLLPLLSPSLRENLIFPF